MAAVDIHRRYGLYGLEDDWRRSLNAGVAASLGLKDKEGENGKGC
jgi:hypothetical protein